MKKILFVILFLSVLASFAYADEVKFAWDPNDPAPEGYRIFQAAGNDSYDFTVPVWEGIETTATIEVTVPKGEAATHRYVVRAFVGDEESADSNEVVHTIDKRALAPVQTFRIVIDVNLNP